MPNDFRQAERYFALISSSVIMAQTMLPLWYAFRRTRQA